MIIRLLSKRHFAENFSSYNILDLFVILSILLAICEGQRERERDAARKQLGLAQIGVHGGNGTDEIVRREQKLNAPLPCADENAFP